MPSLTRLSNRVRVNLHELLGNTSWTLAMRLTCLSQHIRSAKHSDCLSGSNSDRNLQVDYCSILMKTCCHRRNQTYIL